MRGRRHHRTDQRRLALMYIPRHASTGKSDPGRMHPLPRENIIPRTCHAPMCHCERGTCFRHCSGLRPVVFHRVHYGSLGLGRPVNVQAWFPRESRRRWGTEGVMMMSVLRPGCQETAWVFSERTWPRGSNSWRRLPTALFALGSVWRGQLTSFASLGRALPPCTDGSAHHLADRRRTAV